MIMLLVLLVIGAVWQNLRFYFQGESAINFGGIWSWLLRFWPFLKFLAVILIPLFVLWTIYNLYKLKQIEEEEKKIFGGSLEDTIVLPGIGPVQKENTKWLRVLDFYPRCI